MTANLSTAHVPQAALLMRIPMNGHRTRKTSGRTGLCPEETTKISILSGRNRFIPDEILIEGQKIKTTGELLTGGRSAALLGERIAQHPSERAPNAEDNYDALSLNQKNIRQTGLSPVKRTGIYAKESGQFSLVVLFEERRLPTLPPGRAVPSAMTGLASLFGMGRGGSPSL